MSNVTYLNNPMNDVIEASKRMIATLDFLGVSRPKEMTAAELFDFLNTPDTELVLWAAIERKAKQINGDNHVQH